MVELLTMLHNKCSGNKLVSKYKIVTNRIFNSQVAHLSIKVPIDLFYFNSMLLHTTDDNQTNTRLKY